MEPFSNPEASRRYDIAQKSFATFASDVGGAYVPKAKFSKQEIELATKMLDFKDTWFEWISKEFDHELYKTWEWLVHNPEKIVEAIDSNPFPKRSVVNCQFRSFLIRFELNEYACGKKDPFISVSVSIKQQNLFSLTLINKPMFDLGGDVVVKKKLSDKMPKLFPPVLLEWYNFVPSHMYRLTWRAPMLQDTFRAQATDRLLGELLVHDKRLRASLLNIRKLCLLSLSYPDILYPNVQTLLYRGEIREDDVRHLKDILKLMQDFLEVCTDLDIIES